MANVSEPPVLSTRQIAWSIRHLIVYAVIFAFGSGVTTPMSVYVGMDFFAQKYTDLKPDQIRCEYSMLTPWCRQAVFDSTHMMMLLSVASPIVQFVMLPAVGVLSDAFGRWRLVIAYHIVGSLPAFACLSFSYLNTSMYWYYALVPFTMNPITMQSWGTVVYYAIVADLVEQPGARSTGLGTLEAAMALAAMLGNLLGAHLTMRAGMAVCAVICVANFFYALFLLPETLPPERRARSVTWRNLLPGVELSILWRTSALKLVSCVMMVGVFLDAGFGRIIPMYLQWAMNWAAREAYLQSILGSVSIVISLGLIFPPLAARVGDVGLIAIGRVITVIAWAGILAATRKWQILTLLFFSTGPINFVLPAFAGLKSTMVGPEDQGIMQGALSTIFNVAGSLGVFVFGAIFDATNRQLQHPPPGLVYASVNKTAFVICTAMAVPLMWLIYQVHVILRANLRTDATPCRLESQEDQCLVESGGKPAAVQAEAVATYGSAA